MTYKEKLLQVIGAGYDGQAEKGLRSYGKTLEEADDDQYDWNFEANRELIDLSMYQHKEIERLNMELKKAKRLALISEMENHRLKTKELAR